MSESSKQSGNERAGDADLPPCPIRGPAPPTSDCREHERAKRALAALAALYAVRSRVDEAIVRIRHERPLYEEACRILTEEAGFPLVWIGLLDQREVVPVAWSGPASDYVGQIRVQIDGELGAGPTGTAVRERRTVVNDDFDTNPSTTPFRTAALAHGFRASAAFPLYREAKIVGALSLYAGRPGSFDADHVSLLEALAVDLSYALGAMGQERLRTEAEEALRQSEARYRSLFTAMCEGFALHEIVCGENGEPRDYRFLEINPAFETLTGLKRADVVGRLVSEVLPGNEPHWVQTYGRVALTGEPARFESYAAALGRYYEVFAYRPAPRQFAVLFVDVTDRKRAEERLRASEERFKAVASNTPDHLLVQDRDLRYTFVMNPQLDLTAEEMIGKTDRDFLAKDDADKLTEIKQQVIETGRAVHVEVPILSPKGGRQYFDGSYVPSFDAQGRVNGLIGYFRDVTDRKRIEDALRETDRQKNEFMAMLSHELRNPLAPIQNSLHILERAAAGSDQAKRAKEVVARQMAHLRRLLDDLLDVTRLTRGTLPVERGQIDLAEVVRRIADDHRPMFAQRGVSFEVRANLPPLFVAGDSIRLAQAVGNLLHNAAKFAGQRGQVVLALEHDPVDHVAVIRVRDTGVGIGPEVMRTLFDPFTQADRTLDRSEGGLGLGLAIVKGVVDAHGGSVTAHSDGLGTGAEIVVRLPVAPQAVAPARTPEPPVDRPARLRVLVIEDNEDAAETLRDVLELVGNDVEIAFDGPQGIEKAPKFKPDVVFCDIGLPGMDGYAVARAFRADERLRSVRLVALSGYAQPDDKLRATEAGFDRHIAKPPRLEQIEKVLRELAQR